MLPEAWTGGFSDGSCLVFSVLLFWWRKGEQRAGSGHCLAPFLDEDLVPMLPPSACGSCGGDGDGHCHHVSRHWPWSSHIGCTLNWSLLTQGHAEGTLFLLPENILSCSYLKKILEENKRGLGTYHCRFCSLSQCRPNLGSLKIPAVVLGRVLALRSPPGWCYLPIPLSPLNSQLKQWAYLPKINSKSLEDSFTKLGSRSVLGFFQSFTFFLSLLDAHFKVSVCLNQRNHMWLHLYI